MEVFTSEQLRKIQLFCALRIDQCEALLDRHLLSHHQAGQLFVMEQDWDEAVFLICSGIAKVRSYTTDGDEAVMSLLGEGDVFGELSLIKSFPRSADVVALTSGTVL